MLTRKPPKPKLKLKEVYDEIAKRTASSPKLVEQIIKAYQSIVYQCLLNKIEVPFGTMGKFGFKIIPPREHIEWNGWDRNHEPVIFYQDKADGYVKFNYHFYPTFWKGARDKTQIPYGTMPSVEGCKEHFARSEEYVNYDEYKKQIELEKEQLQEKMLEENTDNNDKEEFIEEDDYDKYL